MEDLLALLFIALVCTGLGFAAGGLYAGLRTGKDAQAQPPAKDALDVVHLWRERRSGRLWPVIAWRKFGSPHELSPAQRARLVQAAAELYTWLGDELVPAGQAAEGRSTHREPGGPAADAAGAALEPTSQPPQPAAGFHALDLGARPAHAQPVKAPAPRSLASEVDEILQERLKRVGRANQGVRLLELPGQGIVVLVGMERYDGLEAVPDPEIRALIRECVKEWEARPAE